MNTVMNIISATGVQSMGSKSTSRSTPSMEIPTMISAGAVAAVGMLMNSGAKSMDAKKKMEVITEAKPVRAPASTPEADST